MESFISFWNGLMIAGVFAGLVYIMGLIYTLILPGDKFSKAMSGFVSKNILVIGFLLSLAAMVSSLVYSDIIGYPPCMFCWYARVMFYPQVFLFGRALLKKDQNILPYATILTVLGFVITVYHSIIQIVGESLVPCAVSGVSCLTRDVYVFGFITIPFMGVVGFGALLFSLLVTRSHHKKNIL